MASLMWAQPLCGTVIDARFAPVTSDMRRKVPRWLDPTSKKNLRRDRIQYKAQHLKNKTVFPRLSQGSFNVQKKVENKRQSGVVLTSYARPSAPWQRRPLPQPPWPRQAPTLLAPPLLLRSPPTQLRCNPCTKISGFFGSALAQKI